MKRLITIITLMSTLMLFAGPGQAVKSKFRLGYSKRQVWQTEGKPNYKAPLYYSYSNRSISGMAASKTYYFYKNKVFMVLFTIQTSSNGNSCLNNFLKINDRLIKKYGTFEKAINWKNDYLKNDSKQYGKAILYGYLTIQYDKAIGNGISIIHKIGAEKYVAQHYLFYVDTVLQAKYLKAKKDKESKEL